MSLSVALDPRILKGAFGARTASPPPSLHSYSFQPIGSLDASLIYIQVKVSTDGVKDPVAMVTWLGQTSGGPVMQCAGGAGAQIRPCWEGNNDGTNIEKKYNYIVFFFFLMRRSVSTCVFTLCSMQQGITWSTIYKTTFLYFIYLFILQHGTPNTRCAEGCVYCLKHFIETSEVVSCSMVQIVLW